MLDTLESGDKFLDISTRRRPSFSKTDHLANTIYTGAADQDGRWVLVKDNLMF